MTENSKSADGINFKVLEEAAMSPLKKSGIMQLTEILGNKVNRQDTINENEIKDILEDKELKENLIQMILQNEWPISEINNDDKFAKFLLVVQRDIESKLSDELSKIDITEGNSDKSDLIHKKMTNYMLEIAEKLFENSFDDYSSMVPTSKFEYEVIIEKVNPIR
jgi:hypothetical protein